MARLSVQCGTVWGAQSISGLDGLCCLLPGASPGSCLRTHPAGLERSQPTPGLPSHPLLIHPCLLLVLLWGIQLCQAAAGFIFHQRASLRLCRHCGTGFFLSCHISDGIRTSLCTLSPTARSGRGQLGEAHLGDRGSVFGGLTPGHLPLFPCPGVRVGCGAGTPPGA